MYDVCNKVFKFEIKVHLLYMLSNTEFYGRHKNVNMIQILIRLFTLLYLVNHVEGVSVNLEPKHFVTYEDTLTSLSNLSVNDPDDVAIYAIDDLDRTNAHLYSLSVNISHGSLSFSETHNAPNSLFHVDGKASAIEITGSTRALNTILRSLTYLPTPNWSSCEGSDDCIQEVQTLRISTHQPPNVEKITFRKNSPFDGGEALSNGSRNFNALLNCSIFADQLYGIPSDEDVAHVMNISIWEKSSFSDALNRLMSSCYEQVIKRNLNQTVLKTTKVSHAYAHVTENEPIETRGEMESSFHIEFVNAPFISVQLFTFRNSSINNKTLMSMGAFLDMSIEADPLYKDMSQNNVLDHYHIGYPSQDFRENETVSVPLTSTANELQRLLSTLTNIGDIRVTHSIPSEEYEEYDVTFLSSGNPGHIGDIPMLQVWSSSNTAVSIYEKVKGKANTSRLSVALAPIRESSDSDESHFFFNLYVLPRNDFPELHLQPDEIVIVQEDALVLLEKFHLFISDQDDDFVAMNIFCDFGKFGKFTGEKDEFLQFSLRDNMKRLILHGKWRKINETLKKIQFQPNLNFHGVIDMHISVKDANGAEITHLLPVFVNPVNDAPVMTISSGNITTTTYTKTLVGAFNVTDVDNTDESLTLSMSCSNGILMFKDELSRLFLSHFVEGDINGDDYIVVKGRPFDLTKSLNSLIYRSIEQYIGEDAILFSLDDGQGGIIQSRVNVQVDTKYPRFHFDSRKKRTMIHIEEDTDLNLGDNIHLDVLSDDYKGADWGTEKLLLSFGAKHGTIHANKQDLNKSFSSDNFSFQGTPRETHDYLQQLTYVPPFNFAGLDRISLNLHHTLQKHSSAITTVIIVTPVNDIPVIQCDTDHFDVLEGREISLPSINVSDVDLLNDFDDTKSSFLTISLHSQGKIDSNSKSSDFIPLQNCNNFQVQNNSYGNFCFQAMPDQANFILDQLLYEAPFGISEDEIKIRVYDNLNWENTIAEKKIVKEAVKTIHVNIQANPELEVFSSKSYRLIEDSRLEINPILILKGKIPERETPNEIKITFKCYHGSFLVTDDYKSHHSYNSTLIVEGFFEEISSTLNKNGIVYIPAKDFFGKDEINSYASINIGHKEISSSFHSILYITPSNDPPSLQGAETLHCFQNDRVLLSSLKLSDPDDSVKSKEILTLNISSSIGNVSAWNIHPGVRIISESNWVALQGSINHLNNAVTNEAIFFSPPGEWTGNVSIVSKLSDTKQKSSFLTTSISVHPAPKKISLSTFPHEYKIFEDDDFFINDAGETLILKTSWDPENSIFACKISAQHGSMQLKSHIGDTGNLIEISGTKVEINRNFDALKYVPNRNYNGLDSIECGCVFESLKATSKLSIIIFAVNDKPTFMVSPQEKTMLEDSAIKLGSYYPIFHVLDPDAHENNGHIFAEISTSHGQFQLPEQLYLGGLSANLTNFDQTVSLQGVSSKLNTALKQLKMIPPQDWSGEGVLTLKCNDLGNHGYDNVRQENSLEDIKEAKFYFSPVNDPPAIRIGNNNRIQSNEDVNITMKGLVSIQDVDWFDSDHYHLSLSISNQWNSMPGFFYIEEYPTIVEHFSSFNIEQFERKGNSSGIRMNGNMKSLQLLLEHLVFVPEKNWNGYCKCINITLIDAHNLSTTAEPLLIIQPVNDAPLIITSSKSLDVLEDVPLLLSQRTNITIVDYDSIFQFNHERPTFTVMIKTEFGGEIYISTPVHGCFVFRQTKNSIAFKGTLEVVNEVMKKLYYVSCENCNGFDKMHFSVGNDGYIELGVDLTTEYEMFVNITAMNDPPSILNHNVRRIHDTNKAVQHFELDSRINIVDADSKGEILSVLIEIYPYDAANISFSRTCKYRPNTPIDHDKKSSNILEIYENEYYINEAIQCVIIQSWGLYDANLTVQIFAKDHLGESSTATKDFFVPRILENPLFLPSTSGIEVKEDEKVNLGFVQISGMQEVSKDEYDVEISSVVKSVLAVHNITTFAKNRRSSLAVQEIFYDHKFHESFTFQLMLSKSSSFPHACASEPISIHAVGSKSEEVRNGEDGKGTGESLESKLNSANCVKESNLKIEVHRYDEQQYHRWLVTFHDAPFDHSLLTIFNITAPINSTHTESALMIKSLTSSSLIKGYFTLRLGSFETKNISASASAEEFSVAISDLPIVSTVSVSRVIAANDIQSFTWLVTFYQMQKDVPDGDISTMTVEMNSLEVGENDAGISASQVQSRRSHPELWTVTSWLTQETNIVYRMRIAGADISGFFSIVLDGIGKTRPIDISASVSTDDEILTTGIDYTNHTWYHGNPNDPHNENSFESFLMSLEHWPKYTRVKVTRSETQMRKDKTRKRITWDITFINPLPTFPKLQIDYNGTLFGRDLKIHEVKEVSRSHIGGYFSLHWNGIQTHQLPYNASAELIKIEIARLMQGTNDETNIEVCRSNYLQQYGSYKWTIALLYSSSIGLKKQNLVAIGSNLTGSGVQINSTKIAEGPSHGKFSLSNSIGNGLFFPSEDKKGDSEVIKMRGSIKALNKALSNLIYFPPKDFFGSSIMKFTLVSSSRNHNGENDRQECLNVNVNFSNEDDAPQFLWNMKVGAVNFKNTLRVLEDNPLHFETYANKEENGIGLRILDVDSGIRNLTLEIEASNGLLCLQYNVRIDKCDLQRVIVAKGDVSYLNRILLTLLYRPTNNWWGTDKVKLRIIDGKINNQMIFFIRVLPVNDPPAIISNHGIEEIQSNSIFERVDELQLNEDESLEINFLSVTDNDAITNTKFKNVEDNFTMLLQVSRGTIDVDFSTDVISTIGGRIERSRSIVVQGKISKINSILKSIIYRADKNFVGKDELVVTVSDYGFSFDCKTGTVISASNSTSKIISIRTLSVNDTPYITLPKSTIGYLVALEDTMGMIGIRNEMRNTSYQHAQNFLSYDKIQINDVDMEHKPDENDTFDKDEFTVTLEVENGEIMVQNLDSERRDQDRFDDIVVLNGSLSDLNNALTTIHFIGDRNFNSETQSDFASIYVSVSDFHGSSSSSTLFIFIAAVNDKPILKVAGDTFSVPLMRTNQLFQKLQPSIPLVVAEDSTIKIPISLTDVDLSNDEDRAELEIFSSYGSFFLDEKVHLSRYIIGRKGEFSNPLKFQCSINECNNALKNLKYHPHSDYNGPDAIVIHVSDLGNLGYIKHENHTMNITEMERNSALFDTLEIDLFVQPMRDDPILEIVPFIQVQEDTPFILNHSAQIVHVDSNDDKLLLAIDCIHGTLTITSVDNIVFTKGDGKLDSSIEGSGTSEVWNKALSHMLYIPDSNWNTHMLDDDYVTFSIYNVDSEGVVTESPNEFKMFIDVLPINDKPEWIIPGRNMMLQDTGGYIVDSVDTLEVDEDCDLVITSISIQDADTIQTHNDIDTIVKVSINAANGTLLLYSTSGLWFLEGNNKSQSMTWRATLENSNIALSRLVYRGNPNFFGSDKIDFFVEDEGNDRFSETLVSYIEMPILVRPIDDSPVIFISKPLYYCAENTWCEIKDVSLIDNDSNATLHELEIKVEKGFISFAVTEYPSSIEFINGEGSFDSFCHLSGRLQDLNFLLANLVFMGTATDVEIVDSISFFAYNTKEDILVLSAENEMYIVVSNTINDPPKIRISGGEVDSSDCISPFRMTSNFDSLSHESAAARKNIKCNRFVQYKQVTCMEHEICTIQGIEIEDPDSRLLELSLLVQNGKLALPTSATGLHLKTGRSVCPQIGTSKEKKIVLRGTAIQLNLGLASLQYLGDIGFAGVEQITITVRDNEESSATANLLLQVHRVDYSPYLYSLPNMIEVMEDKFTTFQGLHVGRNLSMIEYCFNTYDEVQTYLKNAQSILTSEIDGKVIQLHVTILDGKIKFSSTNDLNFTVYETNKEQLRQLKSNNLWYGLPTSIIPEDAMVGTSNSEVSSGKPQQRWWTNVTVQGTVNAINRALKHVTFIPNENWNSEISKRHSQLIVAIRDSNTIEDNFKSSQYYEQKVSIPIVVHPQNDSPILSTSFQPKFPINGMNHFLIREDEEAMISIIVHDVDDDILNIKIELNRGLITLDEIHYQDHRINAYLVSGTLKHSDFIELKGTLDSLNFVMANMTFVGDEHYSGDDCTLTITATDSSGGETHSKLNVSISPKDDDTELWVPIAASGLVPTIYVREANKVKIGYDWMPYQYMMKKIPHPNANTEDKNEFKRLDHNQVYLLTDADELFDANDVYDVEISVTKGLLHIEAENNVVFGKEGKSGGTIQMYGAIDDINEIGKNIYFSTQTGSNGWTQLIIKVKSRRDDCKIKNIENINNTMINHEWCSRVIESAIDIFIEPMEPRFNITYTGIEELNGLPVNEEIEIGGFVINIIGGENYPIEGTSLSEGTSQLALKVSLQISAGALSLSSRTRLSFIEGNGNKNKHMLFYGTLLDINKALENLELSCPQSDRCVAGSISSIELRISSDIITGLEEKSIAINLLMADEKDNQKFE